MGSTSRLREEGEREGKRGDFDPSPKIVPASLPPGRKKTCVDVFMTWKVTFHKVVM